MEKTRSGEPAIIPAIFSASPHNLQSMVNREILTFDQAKHFMVPSLDDLPDPFLMQDMEIAVERLALALENGEKISS